MAKTFGHMWQFWWTGWLSQRNAEQDPEATFRLRWMTPSLLRSAGLPVSLRALSHAGSSWRGASFIAPTSHIGQGHSVAQTLRLEFFVGRASDIKRHLKNIVCPFRACSFRILISSFIDFLPLLSLPRMPHGHCVWCDLGKHIIYKEASSHWKTKKTTSEFQGREMQHVFWR